MPPFKVGGLADPVAFRVMQLARVTGCRPSEILAGDVMEGIMDLRVVSRGLSWQNEQVDRALDRLRFEQALGTESILYLILNLLRER